MFILKKTAAQFLSPLSIILIFLCGGLYLLIFTSRQKHANVLLLTGTLLLMIISYTTTADIILNPLMKAYTSYTGYESLHVEELPRVVVVLGAGYNSHPSMPVVSRIGYDSLVRLIEGIKVFRMLSEGKLLLSGGSDTGSISSAKDMAELAVALGVNKDDIMIESRSRDTHDQAEIIKSMVKEDSFILVTSSSHMPRAIALFQKEGLHPIPVPTRSIEDKIMMKGPNPYFPSSNNIQKVEMALHEYLGIAWAWLKDQI